MQKACKAFFSIAGRVLFIGFSIQIVLGICWMAANFFGFRQFGESALYVEISKSFICDEYEGILYPLLILIARGIEEFFRIPYHYILYLIQLCLAYFASYKLLQSVGVKGKFLTAWASMAMLTFPMAMQCHLAVLPDSLTSTFLLLEFSFIFDILRKKQQMCCRQFAKVLVFWLLTALLQPVYFYLGLLPVIILFLFSLVKTWKYDKKRILYYGILILAFAGMITGVEKLTQVEGYYGRVHQSLNASLASRFAWPYVGKNYEFWPEEVKEQIPWNEALQIDYYADNMERILGRTLEKSVGVERAEELFGEIAELGWVHQRDKILHSTAWDIVGYTFSPLVLQRQLTGKAYDSYSGRNYDIMRMKTPQLTEYYLNYGCWWFAAGLGVTVLIQLVTVVKALFMMWTKKNHIAINAGKIISVIICLFTCGGLVLLYTLQGAGMMDYKKSVVVILLWILWTLLSCAKGIGRRE